MEAKFSSLIHFLAKFMAVLMVHYATSCNLGLLQGNSVPAAALGLDHWILRLYKSIGLPIGPAVREHARRSQSEACTEHQRRQTTHKKAGRVKRKQARGSEQEAARKYRPRPASDQHTYGDDDRELPVTDLTQADAGVAEVALEEEHAQATVRLSHQYVCCYACTP